MDLTVCACQRTDAALSTEMVSIFLFLYCPGRIDLFWQLVMNIFVKHLKKRKNSIIICVCSHPAITDCLTDWYFGCCWVVALHVSICSNIGVVSALVYAPGRQNQTGASPNSGPHVKSQLDLQNLLLLHTFIFVFLNDCYSSSCIITWFHVSLWWRRGGSKRIRRHMSDKNTESYWVLPYYRRKSQFEIWEPEESN